jgi:hypothetical protein
VTTEQLITICAAIIYAGGDDAEKPASYTPEMAVTKACQILRVATIAVAEGRQYREPSQTT